MINPRFLSPEKIKNIKTNRIVKYRILSTGFLPMLVVGLVFWSFISIDLEDNFENSQQFVDNPYCEKEILNSAKGFSLKSMNKINFIENKGQLVFTDQSQEEGVRFALNRGNTSIFLLDDGMALQFKKTENSLTYDEPAQIREKLAVNRERVGNLTEDKVKIETFRMDMRLLGANSRSEVMTEGRGKDPIYYYNHNAEKAYHYSKVTYREVYPNIDWVIYTTVEGIKYDFVVHPGGDPSLIKLEFNHHEILQLDEEGNLIHGNRLGQFIENAPISFQNGEEIETKFVLEDNLLSFKLGEYSGSETLIIDPNRIWGTYYGDNDRDKGESVAVDSEGNIYIAGEAKSTNNIASGGHQVTFGGESDAFLVKFNPAGERLWSTYYGGSDSDVGKSVAVDGNDNVFLGGYTFSENNIATTGAHKTTLTGFSCAFLVKFNAAGERQWGTYYGGEGDEFSSSVAVDGLGNVFLSGDTYSANDISTTGAHQETKNGFFDAFLVKFNSDGVRQWGTYYGGTGDELAAICAADNDGNVYLTGRAGSADDIATTGAHQEVYGGVADAFLVKFNAAGVRQWGTYYGGDQLDVGEFVTVDNTGKIYMGGSTRSSNQISTTDAHQEALGGFEDAFLAVFDNNGTLQWATYYGGAMDDFTTGFSSAFDDEGNVYMAGRTDSEVGISTPDAHQENYGGGIYDAFLVKFNASGERQWGTYYGGGDLDQGMGVAVDSETNIYMTGFTGSTNNISSDPPVHQQNFGGGILDAFLVKFGVATPCTDPDLPTLALVADPICSGETATIQITGNLNDADEWHIYSGSCGGTLVGSTPTASFDVSPTTTTTYFVRGEGGCVTPGLCEEVTVNVNVCFSLDGSVSLAADPMQAIEGVNIHLSGDAMASTTTDVGGDFGFLLETGNYTLTPEKNTTIATPGELNTFGVNSDDLNRLINYLNGTELMTDYQLIAGDVRSTDFVGTADRVVMHFALLGNTNALNFWNTDSYFFVDADYTFANPNLPWGYPNQLNYTNLNQDIMGADFVGIKKGDVVNALGWRQSGELSLLIEDVNLTDRTQIEVPVRFSDFNRVTSFQMALEFDPSQLTFAGVEVGEALPGFDETDIGLFGIDQGIIRVVWAEGGTAGANLNEDQVVFTLVFDLEGGAEAYLSDYFNIAKNDLHPLGFKSGGTECPIDIEFTDEVISSTEHPVLHAIDFTATASPNPFAEEAVIRLHMPASGTLHMEIYSMDGRQILSEQHHMNSGASEIKLGSQQMNQPGLYFIHLRTDTATKVLKLIRTGK